MAVGCGAVAHLLQPISSHLLRSCGVAEEDEARVPFAKVIWYVRFLVFLRDASPVQTEAVSRCTVLEAKNYADLLIVLNRFEEARSLLRRMIPVARRVLGDNDSLTLVMRKQHAQSLYRPKNATLDDLREAVTTLEDTARIARRVLGGAHPTTMRIERDLRKAAQAALRAHTE